jgi:hypothetical protein
MYFFKLGFHDLAFLDSLNPRLSSTTPGINFRPNFDDYSDILLSYSPQYTYRNSIST